MPKKSGRHLNLTAQDPRTADRVARWRRSDAPSRLQTWAPEGAEPARPRPGRWGVLPQTWGSPLPLLQPHLQWSICFIHFTYSPFTPRLLESHTNVYQPAVPPTREHVILAQDRGAKFFKGAEQKAGIERTISCWLHLNN